MPFSTNSNKTLIIVIINKKIGKDITNWISNSKIPSLLRSSCADDDNDGLGVRAGKVLYFYGIYLIEIQCATWAGKFGCVCVCVCRRSRYFNVCPSCCFFIHFKQMHGMFRWMHTKMSMASGMRHGWIGYKRGTVVRLPCLKSYFIAKSGWI